MRRLLLVATLTSVTIAAHPVAAWDTTRSTSPVDDSATVVIIQEAAGTYENRYGRLGRANMQILCEENTTGMAIVLPELYTSDIGGLGKVTFRSDADEAFTVQMRASNDRSSLMLISGEAIKTIKRFMGGSKLFAQTLTVREPVVRMEFDLTGLEAAIEPVRETCGW